MPRPDGRRSRVDARRARPRDEHLGRLRRTRRGARACRSRRGGGERRCAGRAAARPRSRRGDRAARTRRRPRRRRPAGRAPRGSAAPSPGGRRERDRDARAGRRRGRRAPRRARRARLVLRELPRRGLLDVTVEPAHDLPDRSSAPVRSKRVEPSGHVARQRGERRGELAPAAGAGAERAVAVAGDHRRRPREQVAEVVAELALVALVQARRCEASPSWPNETARAHQKRTGSAP